MNEQLPENEVLLLPAPKLGADDVLAWLLDQPDDRMFESDNIYDCLVAQYLADLGYEEPAVLGYAFRYGPTPPTNPYIDLPKETTALIADFDAMTDDSGTSLFTAAEVREALRV